jgi:hypothetical protein
MGECRAATVPAALTTAYQIKVRAKSPRAAISCRFAVQFGGNSKAPRNQDGLVDYSLGKILILPNK